MKILQTFLEQLVENRHIREVFLHKWKLKKKRIWYLNLIYVILKKLQKE